MKNISDNNCRENKTHFVFNNFFSENRTFEGVEEYGTARQATGDNIIRRRKDN